MIRFLRATYPGIIFCIIFIFIFVVADRYGSTDGNILHYFEPKLLIFWLACSLMLYANIIWILWFKNKSFAIYTALQFTQKLAIFIGCAIYAIVAVQDGNALLDNTDSIIFYHVKGKITWAGNSHSVSCDFQQISPPAARGQLLLDWLPAYFSVPTHICHYLSDFSNAKFFMVSVGQGFLGIPYIKNVSLEPAT